MLPDEFEWWRSATIYHVMIDRFAGYTTASEWLQQKAIGGNLRGIADKLDYLADLGIDALMLTPWFNGSKLESENTVAVQTKDDGYHGYHGTDFMDVDPRFGSVEDVEHLLQELHKRNMRLIMDVVPNHMRYTSPWFQHAFVNADSPYRDWFVWHDVEPGYMSFKNSFPEIPKLRLDGAARDYVTQSIRKWLQLGVDSVRVDHVIGPTREQIYELIEPLRKEFPQVMIFGEAWFDRFPDPHEISALWSIEGDTDRLKIWFDDEREMYRAYQHMNGQPFLDGCLNFKTRDLLLAYTRSNDKHDRDNLKDQIYSLEEEFPDWLLIAFLGNHDTNRLSFELCDEHNRIKDAFELLFELRQPVLLYYGDELGMTQQSRIWHDGNTDTLCRAPMPWKRSKSEEYWLDWFKEQIRNRRKRAAAQATNL